MSNSESRKRDEIRRRAHEAAERLRADIAAANPVIHEDPDPHVADWITAHDAKVAARALREAASALDDGLGPDMAEGVDYTYALWLDTRADEIERAERPRADQ